MQSLGGCAKLPSPKLAIVAISYNRPDYLRIFLQGMSHVRGIENYPFFIFFDYFPHVSIRRRHEEIIKNFGNLGIIPVFRTRNLGVLGNITESYHDVFDRGYEEIVMFESDIIVRSDSLEYLKLIDRDSFFYTLNGNSFREGKYGNYYRAHGNLLESKNFPILYEWVKNKEYVGRPDRAGNYILKEGYGGHDAVYSRFMIDKGLMTRIPPLYYVAHFGLEGIHREVKSPEEKRVLEKLFYGNPENWLDNAIRILENEEYPVSVETTMKPRGFKYD